MNAPLLRIAAITTALAGFSILPAQAQSGSNSFYPTKSWEVGAVEQDGGAPLCAIQNQLNNGFVVRLNGSSNWLQNMQIDFRQRVFEDNQNYQVALSVPGGSSYTMPAVTEGGNGLRVDLTDGREFYQNLRNAGVFDMELEGNQFRIFMTGFNTNAPHFENCMNDFAEMKNAPKAPALDKPEVEIAAEFEPVEKTAVPAPAPQSSMLTADDKALKPSAHEEATPKRTLEDTVKKMEQTAVQEAPKASAEKTAVKAEAPAAPAEPQHTNRKSPEVTITHEKSYGRVDLVAKEDQEEVARELRQQILDLYKKNRELNAVIKDLETQEEEKRISLSSDNWNLERATLRYNEAERQLRTLGHQLKRERSACEAEKRELEAMLFDPALTSQHQVTKLTKLEKQLRDAKAEIDRLKGQ